MRRDVFFNSEERVWVVFSRQEREQLLQRHSAFCLSGFAYLPPSHYSQGVRCCRRKVAPVEANMAASEAGPLPGEFHRARRPPQGPPADRVVPVAARLVCSGKPHVEGVSPSRRHQDVRRFRTD